MSFSTGLQSKIARIWNAASITGLSDGQRITTWKDSVVGDIATLSSGPALPSYLYKANVFGTYPGLEVEITNQWYNGVNPDFLQPSATISGVYGVFALVKPYLTTWPSGIGGICSVTDFGPSTLSNSDSTIGIEARDNFSTNFVCYEDGEKVGLALNRRSYSSVTGIVSSAAESISSIGGATTLSYHGIIGSIVVLNAVPTDAEALELSNYLRGLGSLNLNPHPKKMTLFFGDSLTSEDASSTPADFNSTYPGLIARYQGISNLTWQNFGWYGCQTPNVLTVAQNQGTTAIETAVAAGYIDITCVVFIGCNNIYSGGSPTAAAIDVQSICTTLRSAGATRIILCTLTARNGSDLSMQATYVANAATYNAALVGMIPTYADAIVRLDQDPNMGPDGSQLSSTYFVSDHVHFTAAGISRVVSDVEPVITTISALSPSAGGLGVASGNGNVSANILFNGSQTITISSSNSSDIIAASTGSHGTGNLTITPMSGTNGFTYTIYRSTAGVSTLTFTNGQGWSNPSNVYYTALAFVPTNVASTAYPIISVTGATLGTISQTDQVQYYFNSIQTLTGPVTVTITSPYANSGIWYTLNGKIPNESSHKYTGPLTFNYNASGSDKTVVKARVYDLNNSNNKSLVIKLAFRISNQTF